MVFETIDGWSEQFNNTIENMVSGTVLKYDTTNKKFPPDALVVGENWMVGFQLSYDDNEPLPKEFGYDSEKFKSDHLITRTGGLIIPNEYVPLQVVFMLSEHFKFLTEGELALFPITQKRRDEARALGPTLEEVDDWYSIQHGGKRIEVFPIPPEFDIRYNESTDVQEFYSRKPPFSLD